MRFSDFKNVSIIDFLQCQNMEPTQKTVDYYKYFAPGRNEKTPSLTVYRKSNTWFDFGNSQGDTKGGDIGKLVQYIYNCEATEALHILNEYATKNLISPYSPIEQTPTKPETVESRIEIIKLIEINHWHLKGYLKERCISLNYAKKYVKEAHWKIKDSVKDSLHSLAFRNDKGGYVLRHKGQTKPLNTKPAYYTTIEIPLSNKLNIFEGFIDFLSALEYYQTPEPKNTTIILNSLSNLNAVIPLLNNFEKVNLFLDNDPESESGQRAAQLINANHPKTVNHALLVYPDFKDFNDFLMNKKS